MIAVDTSTLIAYFSGDSGRDVNLLDLALAQKHAVIPPVVLSEMLSSPALPRHIAALICDLPLLPLSSDFWRRSGELRAKLLAKKVKARLADTLIAQSCLENNSALITRDHDFKAFARYAGLKVLGL